MRLATAVLCALMNFAGLAPTADAADGDDWYEEGGTPDGRSGAIRRGASPALSVASQLSGEPIDDAWVIGGPGHVAGAAVAVHLDGPHVARVDLAAEPFLNRRVMAALGPPLLARALDHCRSLDALKVIVSSEGLGDATVLSVATDRGFQFSRRRPDGQGDCAEFYTDLYWTESPGAGR
jgi:hypothetical protein